MYDLSRSPKKWRFNYLALFVSISFVLLLCYLLFSGLYNKSREGYDTRLGEDEEYLDTTLEEFFEVDEKDPIEKTENSSK